MNVYLEKSDIGATLTTWVYCAMWQLWTAEQLGLKGYIHWPRQRSLQPYQDAVAFARRPNMYDWYFEQPLFDSPPSRDLTWEWEISSETGRYSLMSQPLSVIKAWYRKHFRLNADVNERGEALARKYDIDFSRTIGVTWRGTDCVTDGRPRLPIELYFPFIDDILEPGMRIMATAEEERVLDPLLERYPSAFKVDEFFSSPHGHPHNPERFSPYSGYERGMQPALMVWLFSRCAHYVKNRSSVAAVASWLSTGRIVSLAHAETLSYEKLPDHAEINGERVPLYR